MTLSFVFKGKVYVLRYEDLSLKPHDATNRLTKFLDLSPNRLIDKFLKDHTDKDVKLSDPYSTTRNSKHTAFKWVKLLSVDDISSVQKACSEPMKLLGYNFMSNIPLDKKNNKFSALSKSAKELWPDQFE